MCLSLMEGVQMTNLMCQPSRCPGRKPKSLGIHFTPLEVPKVYCRKLEGEPAHQLMSQLFGCHSNKSLINNVPKILSLL